MLLNRQGAVMFIRIVDTLRIAGKKFSLHLLSSVTSVNLRIHVQ